ncbi:hypothetical protein HJC23_004480 [Cyclotella cryptica]|uniref:GOLD domain-containing protein n=1 Tax=Cyclotella cryptica TaxID=29204 RepID=A0ABD3PS44_9STRA|eukprot:CCRYP_011932-RA/>CCRYP_011932-RA protein AED:0.13 eAED:0.13 QI:0/-1/0/1/-1/1/1/0/524
MLNHGKLNRVIHRKKRFPSALLLTAIICSIFPSTIDAFASFFVDRRASCFTELLVGEVIMNNKVKHHSESVEKEIHLEVSPSGSDGKSFHVSFVMPDGSSLNDVQYVLELSGGGDLPPPAKFTAAPSHGGMGCEDKRVYGKAGSGDSPALVTMNDGIESGVTLEIRGGWATGHEAVTLTEPKVLTVGQEIMDPNADMGDDEYEDDQAEAEHEEEVIEEEREEIEEEIESAEKDAIEALEEKRIETDGLDTVIKDAEEEAVEVLEESRKGINKALNSLKDEIIIEKVAKEKEHDARMREMHRTEKEREEIRKQHREEMLKKHLSAEEQMQRMEHHFKDPHDPRRERLEHFMHMRENFKGNEVKLNAVDREEHERARRDHLKTPPKEKVDADMQDIKQKVKEHMAEQRRQTHARGEQGIQAERIREKAKFHEMHKKMEEDMYNMQRSGVHEMMNQRDVKLVVDKLKGHLKNGLVRGGAAAYHGDAGVPLPPKARNILIGMFAMSGLVGLVRWYLDKRRRAKKGHTL